MFGSHQLRALVVLTEVKNCRMTSLARAPKLWCLTKCETITSFESWKSNFIYVLTLDLHFADVLADVVTLEKKLLSMHYMVSLIMVMKFLPIFGELPSRNVNFLE